MHTNPDGTLDLLEIESKVRSREDAHQPISRLICVEQTHNGTGGRVLSLEYLQRVNFLGTLTYCLLVGLSIKGAVLSSWLSSSFVSIANNMSLFATEF